MVEQAIEAPGIQRITLGAVAVDLCSEPTFLKVASRFMADRSGSPLLVGSVNLDHVYRFGPRRDARRRLIGEGQGWLMLLDGAPLARAAARFTGETWPRLAGADLLMPTLELAAREGRTVAFLGGSTQMAELLAQRLPETIPGIKVVGHWTPPRAAIEDPESSRAILAEIREASPDLLVVGLGKPLQESWIQRHTEEFTAGVVLAFGAAADFIAGTVHRAPTWVQQTGFEWLFRLSQEPRRLRRRYLVEGPQAMYDVVREPRALPTAAPVWLRYLQAQKAAAKPTVIVMPDTAQARAERLGLTDLPGGPAAGPVSDLVAGS